MHGKLLTILMSSAVLISPSTSITGIAGKQLSLLCSTNTTEAINTISENGYPVFEWTVNESVIPNVNMTTSIEYGTFNSTWQVDPLPQTLNGTTINCSLSNSIHHTGLHAGEDQE